MLPRTLEHASRLPYYRARWGSRWRGIHEVEQLTRLPTIDKAEAAKHFAALTAPGLQHAIGLVSSGTSGSRGPLLFVPSIPAESAATVNFVGQWHDWTPPVPPTVARGVALEVRAMHHGVRQPSATSGRLRIPWTYTQMAFRQFVQVLGRTHNRRHITSLAIGAGALMPLTVWMLEQEIDPAHFQVRLIGTHGFRISPFWRARLAQLWNAELWDNFSLSEFATPAMECPDCGFHHWLSPPLVHEVLDVFSHAPLARGIGELTLTGLVPFVQAMPLIRYRTGDLVEAGPRCRRANDRGFRPRGRVTQALLERGVEGDPILVSGQDVQAVLEAESLVARDPHPVERLGLLKSREVGAVKYRLAREKARLLLDVELRFDPRFFVAEARAIQTRAVGQLRRASARLKALERNGKLTLEVRTVAPGVLTAPWSKF